MIFYKCLFVNRICYIYLLLINDNIYVNINVTFRFMSYLSYQYNDYIYVNTCFEIKLNCFLSFIANDNKRFKD